MDETIKGKSAPQDSKIENMEAVKKLADTLLQDERPFDIKSLFTMANKLIKDESLFGMVEDLRNKSNGKTEAAELTNKADGGENPESEDPALLKEQIEALQAELAAIKIEVRKIKEENASLLGLYLKVINAANQDFKKGISLITGISKLLK